MARKTALQIAGVACGVGLAAVAVADMPPPLPVVPQVVAPTPQAAPKVEVPSVVVPSVAPPTAETPGVTVPPVKTPEAPALVVPPLPKAEPSAVIVPKIEVPAVTPPVEVPKTIPLAVDPVPAPVIPPPQPIVPPVAKTPEKEKPAAKPAEPSVSKITMSPGAMSAEALPRMLAEAKTAYAKIHDYAGHYIRQERTASRLIPEETCELRVRTKPFCVSLRVIGPSELAGRETCFITGRYDGKVRFKEANKVAYNTVSIDDPRVMLDSRHLMTDTGLAAVLNRVEQAVIIERRLNNPIQVLVSAYTFAGKPCQRYEVFAERAHAYRYAHRHVIYIDNETKLPVRYEAYDQPRPGGAPGGELIEMQSFVGLKFNVGLGETAFDR